MSFPFNRTIHSSAPPVIDNSATILSSTPANPVTFAGFLMERHDAGTVQDAYKRVEKDSG